MCAALTKALSQAAVAVKSCVETTVGVCRLKTLKIICTICQVPWKMITVINKWGQGLWKLTI